MKYKVEYYYKNHNKLCCVACLSKIKDNVNGQHADCKVCSIKDIENEKKSNLKENIKFLEDCLIKIKSSVDELKKLFEEINQNKENLKMKVSKIFTQIRNAINERESEILSDIDEKLNSIYFNEEIIHNSENWPNKIKKSLEKGKLIEKEWNKNKLNILIYDCINIEKNIEKVKEMNKNIEKCKTQKNNIYFLPEKKNEINEFLKKIKNFDIIGSDFNFQFKEGQNYILSNNGFIATKNNGGDSWNCTIVGNKQIPKNKISKWKIRINNFRIKSNSWNVLIGIGPDNPNNEENFYYKSWSFICGQNKLSIKSGGTTNYNNHNYKVLNKGDIIEVIVDRQLGNLSFSINGENYGIACSEIPKDEILYPVVMINDQNQIVEIIQN